jgi:hypothetical protein
MKRLEVKVTTAGEAGEAVGESSVGIPAIARLIALSVAYDGDCPNTTDVTVKCSLPVEKTLLLLEDNDVDLPLSQVTECQVDDEGAPRAEPATCYPLVMGELTVEVAGCDAIEDAVTVLAFLQL